MFKTPCGGPVVAGLLLAGVALGLAAPVAGAAAPDHAKASIAGLNAWDGRPFGPSRMAAVGVGGLDSGVALPEWQDESSADRDSAEGARTTAEFAGASPLATLAPDAESDALPLSQVGGSHAKPIAAARGPLGVWDFVNRVRYGRLPEPASWGLMLIGFGMIGAALRGFVVASRRLARLQPEELE